MDNEKLYSVGQTAKMTGVTPRTLRYYDKIGLLSPALIRENRYRFYGEREIEKLKRILLFRSFGFPLEEIGGLVDLPPESEEEILTRQLDLLQKKAGEIIRVIRLTKIELNSLRKKEQNLPTDSERKEPK